MLLSDDGGKILVNLAYHYISVEGEEAKYKDRYNLQECF